MTLQSLNINKIFILTVSKVASSAFLYSIPKTIAMHHGHSLFTLRYVLNTQQNTLIIAGVRNPLTWAPSYFFQGFPERYHDDLKLKSNNYVGEYYYFCNKQEIFDKQDVSSNIINKNYPYNDWFNEFFEVTGIKNKPFDKELGYTFYKLPNNNHLLIYTFEKLPQNKQFFEQFFNMSKLLHSNHKSVFSSKLGDLYYKISESIVWPQEFKEKYLYTDIVNYFYSDADIELFGQSG